MVNDKDIDKCIKKIMRNEQFIKNNLIKNVTKN